MIIPMMEILVVEDERLISLALSRMIRELGHSVLACAPSGEAAMEALGKGRADLVLMDIRLEGELDGIETARRLHERWGIPVAYTSAFNDPATRLRAEATGPVAFLAKPIEEKGLKALLENVAARRGGAGGPPPG